MNGNFYPSLDILCGVVGIWENIFGSAGLSGAFDVTSSGKIPILFMCKDNIVCYHDNK